MDSGTYNDEHEQWANTTLKQSQHKPLREKALEISADRSKDEAKAP